MFGYGERGDDNQKKQAFSGKAPKPLPERKRTRSTRRRSNGQPCKPQGRRSASPIPKCRGHYNRNAFRFTLNRLHNAKDLRMPPKQAALASKAHSDATPAVGDVWIESMRLPIGSRAGLSPPKDDDIGQIASRREIFGSSEPTRIGARAQADRVWRASRRVRLALTTAGATANGMRERAKEGHENGDQARAGVPGEKKSAYE